LAKATKIWCYSLSFIATFQPKRADMKRRTGQKYLSDRIFPTCLGVLFFSHSVFAQLSSVEEQWTHHDSIQHLGDGTYTPGSGFKIAKSEYGQLSLKLFAYVRYLNSGGLNAQYTDQFGITKPVEQRNDFQFNKVNIQFHGWLVDPRFRYLAYVWTNNTALGQGAQVVVAGNLSYRFSRWATLGMGINALPGTRSTEGNFPNWLPVDNRLIAEEFFRPSYTTGLWLKGELGTKWDYQAMLGNNLSQLGIDAAQLDSDPSTVSLALGWEPSTGEYGGPNGFGDFEGRSSLATRFGVHYTYNEENRQSQPGQQAPENSQIRLSDGNVIFSNGLFGDSVLIDKARYHMSSLDAGFKFKGWSLDAALYLRTINSIKGEKVDLAPSQLNDWGHQAILSKMIAPRLWQAYAGYALIHGEYGEPWEARFGLNYYPAKNQVVRLNVEYIHTDRSPVGGLSLPYSVGGTGGILNANVMLNL